MPATGKTPSLPQEIQLSWPKSAQWAAAVLASSALILFVVYALTSKFGTNPTELVHDHRLDLNRATHLELMQLSGIGPKLAKRIETYRNTHGLFANVDDLTNVPGIGPAILNRIRDLVYVEPGLITELKTSSNLDNLRPLKTNPKQFPIQPHAKLPAARINVNTADTRELQRLPRIGPVLAARIVAERARGTFRSVNDLRRVHGIGQKTVEHLRPFVTTGK